MKRRPSEAPPDLRPPPWWLLWAAFLFTPALWFGFFMVAYVYTEAVCSTARWMATGVGTTVTTVLFVATLVVALISGGFTLYTRRVRRHAERTSDVYDDFLPRVGYVTGLLVTLVLFAHLVPIVLVGGCTLGVGT